MASSHHHASWVRRHDACCRVATRQAAWRAHVSLCRLAFLDGVFGSRRSCGRRLVARSAAGALHHRRAIGANTLDVLVRATWRNSRCLAGPVFLQSQGIGQSASKGQTGGQHVGGQASDHVPTASDVPPLFEHSPATPFKFQSLKLLLLRFRLVDCESSIDAATPFRDLD